MKKIFTIILLLCGLATFSQNEASFWYFGQNAGLQFDVASGSVTALTNGQLDTLEGCTSISDTNGNLLFYSDGITIWNQNHQVMPNGTGLKGDPSSTSSGLIVPKPQDPTKYYMFTVDEPHHSNSSAFPNETDGDGINDGFMYSLVDMNLDSGNGDVDLTEKNIQLITYDETNPTEVEFKCSEKITAVKADDCSSFWVITHFTNKFYAFKVDVNGVNSDPVISEVGPEVPVSGYRRNALGYLKASPDGSKLVVAHFGFASAFNTNSPGGVYMFDFDNETGEVSNSLELYGPENGNSPYGVEFSSENKRVYATVGLGANGNNASQLLQWDLEATDIPGSIQIIDFSNNLSAGAIQLGLDKRIYRALVDFSDFFNTGRHLGVINNPESLGQDVAYDENGILVDVNGTTQNLSKIGLPPFIQSLFNSEIDIIRNGISTTQLLLCDSANYTLTADDIPGADYTWFQDGNEIIGEETFELLIDEPGFYEVFIEPNNGECPIEGEALVEVFEIPIIATQPADIEVCDTENTFVLTDKDSEILGSLDPSIYDVKYFISQEDADLNENEIIGPFTTNSNSQTIYVVVSNSGNSNCFDETQFTITRFSTPTINNLEDIEYCDFYLDPTDGIAEFDLSTLNADILGNQNDTDYTLSYHETFNDAESDTNPISSLFTNTDPSEEIFVRLENNLDQTCFVIDSFNLITNAAPTANTINILQCDEDGIPEGFTLFNLDNYQSEITDNPEDKTFSYFLSFTDAINEEDPINGSNFNNFFNPQTVFALIVDNTTGCSNIAEIRLEISATSSRNVTLQECDNDGNEDGFVAFNLTDAETLILEGISPDLEVVFYQTYDEALLELNPLATTFTNTITYSQTIYARVENMSACFGISEVELTVFELPNIETEFQTIYCLNAFPETITLTGGVIDDDPSNYYYQWSNGIDDESEIEINEPGTYTVIVSNTDGCSKTRTITVLPSNTATIDNIIVTDAAENNSITLQVSGEGDYEFALDNSVGPYQDSNVFENVSFGFHDVYVRDKNGCGIVSELVSVIGFPKFFTPNDDTVNDFWQVKGISSQFQPNSVIYIFNRYGKLLNELDPLGSGWNGTYNGLPMPSDDYWYNVTLQDGRTFNGHFALRR
ncbi:T9SS type B sorting domain-containing protein [Ichthyenterobacterium sp. W332]|uniref:T9SS type B sorting domain-containing protein n=1 Tax=Microcosmobacter mediterraneus TaxID=3075607 RepID=A0ABU2YNA4_9FLAO|nr:T9SS type B sorting domain-containing protein [Ichthyenterobacterium sp. W332]MDT0559527.1 T9SS type B sorting domain-containing protein [Ichthyenterobacterium sp. W332]